MSEEPRSEQFVIVRPADPVDLAFRRNDAAGLDTCERCLAGVPNDADSCPVCGSRERYPF